MLENTLYSPLQSAYWQSAVANLRSTRHLVAAALLTAARIAMGSIFIPVGESSRIYASFFAVALCAAVCGPLLAGASGFVADILGFLLFPSGVFFFGYTLTAILSGTVYALFFYRRQLNLPRVFLAKASVSLFINVLLGSLWSAVVYGKAYYYYFLKSLVKNALLCPFETVLLFVFFKALVPPLVQSKFLPKVQQHVTLLPKKSETPAN